MIFGVPTSYSAGYGNSFWVPPFAVDDRDVTALSPDLQSGIEVHLDQIHSEEDMRRVIRELSLRK